MVYGNKWINENDMQFIALENEISNLCYLNEFSISSIKSFFKKIFDKIISFISEKISFILKKLKIIKDKFKKSKKNSNNNSDEFEQDKFEYDEFKPDEFESKKSNIRKINIKKSQLKKMQMKTSQNTKQYPDITIKYYKNIADIIIHYLDTIDSFIDDYVYELKEWVKFDANENFDKQKEYDFSDFNDEDVLINKLNSELCEEIVNKDNYKKVFNDILDSSGGLFDATEYRIKKRFEKIKQDINKECKEVLDEFDKYYNKYKQEYVDVANNNIDNMKDSFVKLQNNLISSINKSTKTIIEVCDTNFRSHFKILGYEHDVLKIERKISLDF